MRLSFLLYVGHSCPRISTNLWLRVPHLGHNAALKVFLSTQIVVRRCWESYNIQQMHILQKCAFVEYWKLFTFRLKFIISFFSLNCCPLLGFWAALRVFPCFKPSLAQVNLNNGTLVGWLQRVGTTFLKQHLKSLKVPKSPTPVIFSKVWKTNPMC